MLQEQSNLYIQRDVRHEKLRGLYPMTEVSRNRNCTSPEKSVEWPLRDKGATTSFSARSLSSNLTCGLSSGSPLANFFRTNISTTLRDKFESKCKKLVVYGVALGDQLSMWLDRSNKTSYFREQQCFFVFVSEEEFERKKTSIQSGRNKGIIFVPVPSHILPYKSTRRNVKLFKLHGHLLFPWSEAYIWEDAKFIQSQERSRAKNYQSLLNEFTNDNCVTMMGLPPHINAFGDYTKKTGLNEVYRSVFYHHCETVIAAVKKRPTVTDDPKVLMQQCLNYLKEQRTPESDSFLNRALIDSAFIMWNQKTERCRRFNAELACTWSDEIQCHSDRDQVSFPYALQKMGVQEARIGGKESNKHPKFHNLEFRGAQTNDVLVRILRSSCHWYYQPLDQCVWENRIFTFFKPDVLKRKFFNTMKRFVLPSEVLKRKFYNTMKRFALESHSALLYLNAHWASLNESVN